MWVDEIRSGEAMLALWAITSQTSPTMSMPSPERPSLAVLFKNPVLLCARNLVIEWKGITNSIEPLIETCQHEDIDICFVSVQHSGQSVIVNLIILQAQAITSPPNTLEMSRFHAWITEVCGIDWRHGCLTK